MGWWLGQGSQLDIDDMGVGGGGRGFVYADRVDDNYCRCVARWPMCWVKVGAERVDGGCRISVMVGKGKVHGVRQGHRGSSMVRGDVRQRYLGGRPGGGYRAGVLMESGSAASVQASTPASSLSSHLDWDSRHKQKDRLAGLAALIHSCDVPAPPHHSHSHSGRSPRYAAPSCSPRRWPRYVPPSYSHRSPGYALPSCSSRRSPGYAPLRHSRHSGLATPPRPGR